MFKIIKQSNKTKARFGVIKTKMGKIHTPFFMPDATRGFVKFLSNTDLKNVGPMVVNTYHLYLQPGTKLIKKAGGINKFMNWSHPILSDSGGFQVFSLIHQHKKGKIMDDKVIFYSPIDGAKHELTPEKSIQIQFDLGVDMMVCLDDCPPNSSSKKDIKKSIKRTLSWAARCKTEYEKQIKKRKIKQKDKPILFSVIQGGKYFDLREYCTKELIKIGFDGYGFGAMPIDTKGNLMEDILDFTADLVPENALRFALGIGRPNDIEKCVKLGWDMFDCVIPTREGRHGKLFLDGAKKCKIINIRNTKFRSDFSVIDKNSNVLELKTHSKAYLHHLFKTGDPLGKKLASLNNLNYYIRMMEKLRKL